jgi:hypothetical protein
VRPIWLCWKLAKAIGRGLSKRRGDSSDDTPPSTAAHAEPADPEPPHGDPLGDNLGGADLG